MPDIESVARMKRSAIRGLFSAGHSDRLNLRKAVLAKNAKNAKEKQPVAKRGNRAVRLTDYESLLLCALGVLGEKQLRLLG